MRKARVMVAAVATSAAIVASTSGIANAYTDAPERAGSVLGHRAAHTLSRAEVAALSPAEVDRLRQLPAEQLPESVITVAQTSTFGESRPATVPTSVANVKCSTYTQGRIYKNVFGWEIIRYSHTFNWCADTTHNKIYGTPRVTMYHNEHWGWTYAGEDGVQTGWDSKPYSYRDRRQGHFSAVFKGAPVSRSPVISDCVYWSLSGHGCP